MDRNKKSIYITEMVENINWSQILASDNFENIKKDIIYNLKLTQYYPTMDCYKKYDIYSTQLPWMLLLKKYGLIDNYYTYRKLLLLQDVHDC